MKVFRLFPTPIARAGDRLYEMMSGAEEPVAIIFPQSASDGVEVLYQEFSFRPLLQPNRRRVLRRRHCRTAISPASNACVFSEVGGGTGGRRRVAAVPELDGVSRRTGVPFRRYLSALLHPVGAQQKCADYDFVKYSELDLEREGAGLRVSARHSLTNIIVADERDSRHRHVGESARWMICTPAQAGKADARNHPADASV